MEFIWLCCIIFNLIKKSNSSYTRSNLVRQSVYMGFPCWLCQTQQSQLLLSSSSRIPVIEPAQCLLKDQRMRQIKDPWNKTCLAFHSKYWWKKCASTIILLNSGCFMGRMVCEERSNQILILFSIVKEYQRDLVFTWLNVICLSLLKSNIFIGKSIGMQNF